MFSFQATKSKKPAPFTARTLAPPRLLGLEFAFLNRYGWICECCRKRTQVPFQTDSIFISNYALKS